MSKVLLRERAFQICVRYSKSIKEEKNVCGGGLILFSIGLKIHSSLFRPLNRDSTSVSGWEVLKKALTQTAHGTALELVWQCAFAD